MDTVTHSEVQPTPPSIRTKEFMTKYEGDILHKPDIASGSTRSNVVARGTTQPDHENVMKALDMNKQGKPGMRADQPAYRSFEAMSWQQLKGFLPAAQNQALSQPENIDGLISAHAIDVKKSVDQGMLVDVFDLKQKQPTKEAQPDTLAVLRKATGSNSSSVTTLAGHDQDDDADVVQTATKAKPKLMSVGQMLHKMRNKFTGLGDASIARIPTALAELAPDAGPGQLLQFKANNQLLTQLRSEMFHGRSIFVYVGGEDPRSRSIKRFDQCQDKRAPYFASYCDRETEDSEPLDTNTQLRNRRSVTSEPRDDKAVPAPPTAEAANGAVQRKSALDRAGQQGRDRDRSSDKRRRSETGHGRARSRSRSADRDLYLKREARKRSRTRSCSLERSRRRSGERDRSNDRGRSRDVARKRYSHRDTTSSPPPPRFAPRRSGSSERGRRSRSPERRTVSRRDEKQQDKPALRLTARQSISHERDDRKCQLPDTLNGQHKSNAGAGRKESQEAPLKGDDKVRSAPEEDSDDAGPPTFDSSDGSESEQPQAAQPALQGSTADKPGAVAPNNKKTATALAKQTGKPAQKTPAPRSMKLDRGKASPVTDDPSSFDGVHDDMHASGRTRDNRSSARMEKNEPARTALTHSGLDASTTLLNPGSDSEGPPLFDGTDVQPAAAVPCAAHVSAVQAPAGQHATIEAIKAPRQRTQDDKQRMKPLLPGNEAACDKAAPRTLNASPDSQGPPRFEEVDDDHKQPHDVPAITGQQHQPSSRARRTEQPTTDRANKAAPIPADGKTSSHDGAMTNKAEVSDINRSKDAGLHSSRNASCGGKSLVCCKPVLLPCDNHKDTEPGLVDYPDGGIILTYRHEDMRKIMDKSVFPLLYEPVEQGSQGDVLSRRQLTSRAVLFYNRDKRMLHGVYNCGNKLDIRDCGEKDWAVAPGSEGGSQGGGSKADDRPACYYSCRVFFEEVRKFSCLLVEDLEQDASIKPLVAVLCTSDTPKGHIQQQPLLISQGACSAIWALLKANQRRKNQFADTQKPSTVQRTGKDEARPMNRPDNNRRHVNDRTIVADKFQGGDHDRQRSRSADRGSKRARSASLQGRGAGREQDDIKQRSQNAKNLDHKVANALNNSDRRRSQSPRRRDGDAGHRSRPGKRSRSRDRDNAANNQTRGHHISKRASDGGQPRSPGRRDLRVHGAEPRDQRSSGGRQHDRDLLPSGVDLKSSHNRGYAVPSDRKGQSRSEDRRSDVSPRNDERRTEHRDRVRDDGSPRLAARDDAACAQPSADTGDRRASDGNKSRTIAAATPVHDDVMLDKADTPCIDFSDLDADLAMQGDQKVDPEVGSLNVGGEDWEFNQIMQMDTD